MAKLTSKKLLWIRNIIMLAGIITAYVLWLYVPSTLKNNPIYHFGNGEYTLKEPFLILILMPLVGLIPCKPDDEIHTDVIITGKHLSFVLMRQTRPRKNILKKNSVNGNWKMLVRICTIIK